MGDFREIVTSEQVPNALQALLNNLVRLPQLPLGFLPVIVAPIVEFRRQQEVAHLQLRHLPQFRDRFPGNLLPLPLHVGGTLDKAAPTFARKHFYLSDIHGELPGPGT